jgi:multidrug resistance efflux pump
MHRGNFRLPKPGLSREKNLVLILLAILVALVLWGTFWWMVRLALFIVIVYVIYLVLREYF